MSPSMEKEGIDYEVFKHIFSRAESHRDTLAKYQIHLAAFLCIPVSERLERCLGKHPEKLWVKIPNYFCLSTYGLSMLLLEVYCTSGVDYICRQVHRQLTRNELARFYHHRTRKCIPPRKLRRAIQ